MKQDDSDHVVRPFAPDSLVTAGVTVLKVFVVCWREEGDEADEYGAIGHGDFLVLADTMTSKALRS